ncbi:MAG TPA: hypothetical protein VHN15_02150 [Thermoanaerobaculia bacterium]|nr:hypothetical protein [Thermoanaerobaculia bacterium]
MATILSRQGDLLKQGQVLAEAILANEADLAHLQAPAEKMQSMMEEMKEILLRQGVLNAEKQEASRRVQEIFANGAKLLTFLRKGVLEHYGSSAEKLAEFGLKVYRGRPRRTASPEPSPNPGGTPTTPPVIE